MRVLVVGAGAVGSFLGWAVAAGGGRTTLVRRSFAGPAGTREPLTVARPDGTTRSVEVELVADLATTPEPPELILVAV